LEEVLNVVLKQLPKVLDEPEPLIKVHKLTDLTTRIVVRPWVRCDDYWEVYWDLTREAKVRLAAEGLPVGLAPRSLQLLQEVSE